MKAVSGEWLALERKSRFAVLEAVGSGLRCDLSLRLLKECWGWKVAARRGGSESGFKFFFSQQQITPEEV